MQLTLVAVPKIYQPFRKFALKQIIASSIVGFGLAEAYWHFYAVPKVERRNFVMRLIEEERIMQKDALTQALDEIELPGTGEREDL